MEEYIILWVESYGLIAIFCLMFTNGFFSFPPSEISLLVTGFFVSESLMNIYESIFFAFLGNLVGTFLLFLIAYFLTNRQVKNIKNVIFDTPIIKDITTFIIPSKEKFDYLIQVFQNEGKYYVLLYRCLPLVRSIISFIAGLSKMKINTFIIYSSVGIFIWITIWQFLGYFFGYLWKTQGYYVSSLLLLILAISLYITKKRINKIIYKA